MLSICIKTEIVEREGEREWRSSGTQTDKTDRQRRETDRNRQGEKPTEKTPTYLLIHVLICEKGTGISIYALGFHLFSSPLCSALFKYASPPPPAPFASPTASSQWIVTRFINILISLNANTDKIWISSTQHQRNIGIRKITVSGWFCHVSPIVFLSYAPATATYGRLGCPFLMTLSCCLFFSAVCQGVYWRSKETWQISTMKTVFVKL